MNLLTFSDGSLPDPADFRATFRLAWDEKGLIVLVEVNDQDGVEAKWLKDIWNYDSVEFFMSQKPGENPVGHALISPGLSTEQKKTRVISNKLRGRPDDGISIADPQVAKTRTKNGYVIEARIPWTWLKRRPSKGDTLGFQLMVNDLDNDKRISRHFPWFPGLDTSRNSSHMQEIRLVDKAGPPLETVVVARTDWTSSDKAMIRFTSRHWKAGEKLRLLQGKQVLATGILSEQFDSCFWQQTLAMVDFKTDLPFIFEISGKQVLTSLPFRPRAPLIAAQLNGVFLEQQVSKKGPYPGTSSRTCTWRVPGTVLKDGPNVLVLTKHSGAKAMKLSYLEMIIE
ncbi:MAG: hypothetical protein HRT89_17685 [Lentisphaeria bacterium]|nr:CBM9 family sugar-binding protein [Lentisphaeria bacterium]NQZ69890.1 hypothetical protein [Lentisphaeria bacterium]